MNIRAAMIAHMKNSAPLVALLDDYKGFPAIFSPTAPGDYSAKLKPHILVRRPSKLDDTSPFQGRSSDALVQLSVYGLLPNNSTDDSNIEAVSFEVRERFRGQAFIHEGITYQAIASGPIPAPSDTENVVGEVLQVRLTVGD